MKYLDPIRLCLYQTVIITLLANVYAQEVPNTQSFTEAGSLTTSVEELVLVSPNGAKIDLLITATPAPNSNGGGDLKQQYSDLINKLQSVEKQLKSIQGITKLSLTSDSYDTGTKSAANNTQSLITKGLPTRIKRNVVISVEPIEKIGQVIDAILNIDSTEIKKISYIIMKPSEDISLASARVVKSAIQKLNEIATTNGLVLSSLYEISIAEEATASQIRSQLNELGETIGDGPQEIKLVCNIRANTMLKK